MLDSNTVRQTFKAVARFPQPNTAAICHSNLEKALMIISYVESHGLTSKIEDYMVRRLEDRCIMADRQAEYAAQRTTELIEALNLEANNQQDDAKKALVSLCTTSEVVNSYDSLTQPSLSSF